LYKIDRTQTTTIDLLKGECSGTSKTNVVYAH